jgi:hypothetical protein
MLVAFAALLIHPQVTPKVPLFADKAALDAPVTVSSSTEGNSAATSLPTMGLSTAETPAQPVTDPSTLPDAPTPVPQPAVDAPASMAFLKSSKPMTVSVNQLGAEYHRKQMLWRGLIIASSGAATFDAWSTRHAITTAGAQELDPLLKPFAGNDSLYAAIQVGPLLMDYVGKKMMYSRHSWLRRMWWAPQSASFVASMFCGAHNLSYHNP